MVQVESKPLNNAKMALSELSDKAKMIIETSRKVNFGIYKWKKTTNYGYRTHGEYRTNNIDVYYDNRDKTKLIYVSDMLRNWIKSKLIYFVDGIKKTTRSERKNGLFLNG